MEQKDFFRLVRQDSRDWWYHRQLREQGDTAKARGMEIDSTRNRIKSVRRMRDEGGYCSVGRGGWSYHVHNCTTQGYGEAHTSAVQLAIACGIPTVDTLKISDHDICETICLPMHCPGRATDSPPYNGFSFVSLGLFLTLRKRLGAAVYNYTSTAEDNQMADEFLVQLAERRMALEKEEMAL